MKNNNEVILVKGKWWSGLYVRGELVNQYKYIPEKEIYQYLEDGQSYSTWYVNERWLAHFTWFPHSLDYVWLENERW